MTIEQLQHRAREKWKEIEEAPCSLIRVGTATCGLAAGGRRGNRGNRRRGKQITRRCKHTPCRVCWLLLC